MCKKSNMNFSAVCACLCLCVPVCIIKGSWWPCFVDRPKCCSFCWKGQSDVPVCLLHHSISLISPLPPLCLSFPIPPSESRRLFGEKVQKVSRRCYISPIFFLCCTLLLLLLLALLSSCSFWFISPLLSSPLCPTCIHPFFFSFDLLTLLFVIRLTKPYLSFTQVCTVLKQKVQHVSISWVGDKL